MRERAGPMGSATEVDERSSPAFGAQLSTESSMLSPHPTLDGYGGSCTGGAGAGPAPLVVAVEAAEELRDDELAIVLDAPHTSCNVILRIIGDGRARRGASVRSCSRSSTAPSPRPPRPGSRSPMRGS